MMGFFQILVLVVSSISLLFKSRMVQIDFSAPIPIAQKNIPSTFVIGINNRFHFTISKISVQRRYGSKKKWIRLNDFPRGRKEERIKIQFAKPGNHEVFLTKVKIYDVFGIYHVTRKLKLKDNVLILPEINSVPVRLGEAIRYFQGEADVYDELRAGNDPTETFQIREYRDGDKIQNIHWKLSAKMDELYVKENGFPKACPVVIMLNEADVEELAKISFSIMDAECPHFVSWYSESKSQIIRGRVDDEESFYLMLTTYMQDHAPGMRDDLAELYRQKYYENNFIHWIDIDKRVLIDGQRYRNEEILL